MKLHTYFRSSAAYRVRIALALKQLEWEAVPVHLLRGGGEQHHAAYRALNPAGRVPTLVDGVEVLTQSLAIIEYLDETHANPPLLPENPLGRARVRAIAQTIACDIHPLNNLAVLQYLSGTFGVSDEQKNAWYCHWVENGLAVVEQLLAGHPGTGRFCHGDLPTLADCCLVPQVYNARRFNCDLSALPTVMRIVDHCESLPAFQVASPEAQADAG